MSAPIIGREGLLRLVSLVERLRSRELDEGDASWTARTQTPSDDVHADHVDRDPGGGVLDVGAGGKTTGSHPDAECAAGTDGGRAVPGGRRKRR